jgi:hypothetical protein
MVVRPSRTRGGQAVEDGSFRLLQIRQTGVWFWACASVLALSCRHSVEIGGPAGDVDCAHAAAFPGTYRARHLKTRRHQRLGRYTSRWLPVSFAAGLAFLLRSRPSLSPSRRRIEQSVAAATSP